MKYSNHQTKYIGKYVGLRTYQHPSNHITNFLIVESYALPCYLAFWSALSLCSSFNVRLEVKNEREPHISPRVIFTLTGCKLESKTFSNEQ